MRLGTECHLTSGPRASHEETWLVKGSLNLKFLQSEVTL